MIKSSVWSLIICKLLVLTSAYMQVSSYVYKAKIFNKKSNKKKKFTVQQFHHFNDRLSSLSHLREVLANEFGNNVPDEDDLYNMGYFEGRYQTKRWLECEEDLQRMYKIFSLGCEIFLWCDGRAISESDVHNSQETSKKKSQQSKRQAREEELDVISKTLKEKHGDTYTAPQLHLWARMIISKSHDDMDVPPRVPMILGAPLPKRQKQESITSALVGAATAFAKAMSPPPIISSSSGDCTPSTLIRAIASIGISPGKTVELRMKNLEQLRYLQQLMEDGILSQDEFFEQKEIIMEFKLNLVYAPESNGLLH